MKNSENAVFLEILGQTYEQVFIVSCETGEAEGINTEIWQEERFKRTKIENMDEWLERYFETSYVGDDLEVIQRKTRLSVILEVLDSGKPYVIEYSAREENRVRRKRLFAGRYSENKEILYICCQDITIQYEQEQKNEWLISASMDIAQRANQTKTEFLQKLTQNIRTPLYGIKGYLEQAARTGEMGDETKEYIKKAETCAREFAGQMADVLDVSACENSQLIVKEEAVLINDFLADMEQLFTAYAERKNMTFEIRQLTPEISAVSSDTRRWKQIFEELLLNAFQYGEESGKVCLSVAFEPIEADEEDEIELELELNQVVKENFQQKKEQYMAIIRVENTGCGPKAHEIRRIYEEFYTTEPEGHLGMGIPMVRNFVDHMGGSMEFLSAPEKGVTVEIRIPVKKAGRLQQEQAQLLTHMLPKIHERDFSYCRALVVDDNEINSEITKLKLQRMGLKVDQAWDGDEAVEKLVSSPINYYQIVFMNPQLPGRTGLSATLEIRAQKRRDISDVVIVALTAHPLRDERIRTLEHGMDYHLPLPLDDIELNEILVRELRGVEQEKEYGVLGFRIVK